MLNKLVSFSRQHQLLERGDRVVCAVSGGADSMALLWAMYLLKDQYDLKLSAAHFNHGLRGAESDADAEFVRQFCERFEIPLHLQKGQVTAGKKGLEAAARDARYAFFDTLPGKIATAHTADDNAETVLMHMVRGTGLKGLGGITPVRGRLIRPMLGVTRQQVLAFLEEYHISYVTDSSNLGDDFLRNRLRHHVMPLLQQENPRFVSNMSAMALRLREDEKSLCEAAQVTDRVSQLQRMNSALRCRALTALLQRFGVKEPGAEHIALAESLVFSANPSASARFPGNITLGRSYDILQRIDSMEQLEEMVLPCPSVVEAGDVQIHCQQATQRELTTDCFTVKPRGQVVVRSRRSGDSIRLPGGTKKLKELFIDHKIPASMRCRIPVIADEEGVLGIYGFGAHLDRVSQEGIQIRFIKR